MCHPGPELTPEAEIVYNLYCLPANYHHPLTFKAFEASLVAQLVKNLPAPDPPLRGGRPRLGAGSPGGCLKDTHPGNPMWRGKKGVILG